jgi:predicted nucleic acid-binding protein
MSDRAFFDTNIMVYTQRTDSPDKTRIAESALYHFDSVVSTQVLNELCNIFTKKYPKPLTEIETLLDSIHETLAVVTVTPSLVFRALRIHYRYCISYFDALMVAVALSSGCKYLFSEDMQDGLVVDGRDNRSADPDRRVTIVNIFNHTDLFE